MNKLIVAEKPSVALRVASSLSEGRPKRVFGNGVGYFEIVNGSDTLYVVAAAGHLFSIRQKDAKKDLPIFSVEWVESYKVSKYSYFTKKYLDTIEIISKRCSLFINACDYDVEGTVIGTNIIKFITSGDVNGKVDENRVRRMRFSTTTTADLVNSYKNLDQFDRSNFDAGETRHMLDWMWGINMSRALMRAITISGVKRTLSIGRVQGPTLAILARREEEIANFVSKPYWKLFLLAKGIEFENSRGSILDEKIAEEALEKSKKGEVVVKNVESKENKLWPFPPFDLTSLQLEASRTFRIDPSRTLAIAQSLYEKSYLSYPRTSSQKLPNTLNLSRIISDLGKNPKYREIAQELTSAQRFRPMEGSKEDDAHPAIHPTGEMPSGLTEEEDRIYDIVVKRFLSCFAEYALLTSTNVVLDANGEGYRAGGNRVKSQGWLKIYNYYRPKELEMPLFSIGERISPEKIYSKKLKTEPPKRYNKASLIAFLEKEGLGTKATRAAIIDTLFKREYIKGSSIEVTGFGMSVYKALNEYCNEILDKEMTNRLDTDMEQITRNKAREEDVIKEGEDDIARIIQRFKQNEKGIGLALVAGLKESDKANVIGKCNKCETGNLVIKRSKLGKQFVGCTNWPECSNSYPIPQKAKIVPTGKVCEICHTPKVKVFRYGLRVFEMDLDPNCPTKKDWGKKEDQKKVETPKPQEPKTGEKEENIVVKKAVELKKPKAVKPKKPAKRAKKKKVKEGKNA